MREHVKTNCVSNASNLLLSCLIIWLIKLTGVHCESKPCTIDSSNCKFSCSNIPGYGDMEIDLSSLNDPSGSP